MSEKRMSGMKEWINKSFRLDFTTFTPVLSGRPDLMLHFKQAALSYHSYSMKIEYCALESYAYIYVYPTPQQSSEVQKKPQKQNIIFF